MTIQALRPVRFFLWYARAFLGRHSLVLIFYFTFGFILTIFLLRSQFQTGPPENKIIIGVAGTYQLNNLPENVQNLLSFGLTQVKDNGEIIPKAAEKISLDNTGTIYEIKLKSNLTWCDGKLFTSGDVNYNFKEVDKKITDQDNLQFRLKEPFSPFLSLLSQPIFKKGLVGLGPYKLGRVNFEGETIRSLELLPTCPTETVNWPREFPPELTRRIGAKTKIVVKFYPTTEMVKKALKLGEILVAIGLKNVSTFPDEWYINSAIIDYSRVVTIFFNTKDPLLREKNMRQALAYAIPKNVFENEIRATGPIPPINWAYNGKTKSYEEDLSTAKELLGKSKSATEEAKPRIILSTFPQLNPLAQRIATSWQSLEFSVDITTQTMIPPTFQALLFSQEIPTEPDQYTLWHSTQPGNITGYASARNDKLLEDGRKTIDIDKRKQKYFDFQKYLVEDAPAIFLFYPTIYSVSRK